MFDLKSIRLAGWLADAEKFAAPFIRFDREALEIGVLVRRFERATT